jgi:hypothetical protein
MQESLKQNAFTENKFRMHQLLKQNVLTEKKKRSEYRNYLNKMPLKRISFRANASIT